MAFGDFVQGAGANNDVAGTGTITATIASAVAGHLLVAHATVNGGVTPDISDNLGGTWTEIGLTAAATTGRSMYKIATGGETQVILTPNASVARSVMVCEFVGTFAASPHDTPMKQVTRGTSATWLSTAQHATAANGELVVSMVVMRNGGGGGSDGATFSWSGSLTERLDSLKLYTCASAVIANSGTTPTATATCTSQIGAAMITGFLAGTGTPINAGSGAKAQWERIGGLPGQGILANVNAKAGTTNLGYLAALNVAAGLTNAGELTCLNRLAGTTGLGKLAALQAIT